MLETLDLTKILDETLAIYAEGAYSDPPLQIEPWCDIPERGYKVSRLSLGTQTGTHIDAPAHFSPNGATLDSLPLQVLIGPYLWLDLDHLSLADVTSAYQGESILFLTSLAPAQLPLELFQALLELPCPVWLIVHSIQVIDCDPFYFNRALAEAGKYLIEDVDVAAARQVRPGGELIALPLRLKGVSGSPCRVVVRQ